MTAPRFFVDEDMPRAIVLSLRSAGFDAVGTPETGRIAESDESQLAFATKYGRTLVSYNVADFARLHVDWLRSGKTHRGIVVHRQRNVGDTLKRLLRLAKELDAETLVDRIEFLSDW